MSTAIVDYCPYTHACDSCSFDCEDNYKFSMKIVDVQRENDCVLVKDDHEAFPAKLCEYTRKAAVSVGDYAKVIQSHGEYMLVDYIAMFGGGEF